MRRSTLLLPILAIAAALSGSAAAADVPARSKGKASLAECSSLVDPFKNKKSAEVKDEAVREYAPLIKAYWSKGCPADFYREQIADADLRQRIEAVVPPPKGSAKKG